MSVVDERVRLIAFEGDGGVDLARYFIVNDFIELIDLLSSRIHELPFIHLSFLHIFICASIIIKMTISFLLTTLGFS